VEVFGMGAEDREGWYETWGVCAAESDERFAGDLESFRNMVAIECLVIRH